jgi:hypothetical protein
MPRPIQNISPTAIGQVREEAVKLFSERETKGEPTGVAYNPLTKKLEVTYEEPKER